MDYFLHFSIYLCIYAILSLSLNIVVGYCGLFTLAHASFFTVGAYIYSLIALNLNWGFIPACIASAMVTSVLSLGVSLPAWRFRGDIFMVFSLAVQSLVYSCLMNWTSPNANIGSWHNFTNGPFGIPGVPKPDIFGWKASSLPRFFLVSFAVASFCILLVRRIINAPWGRLLKCLRDDELATRAMGKNTRKAKCEAFVCSAGLAAMAGALYASYIGYIDPSLASLDESILILCMVVLGGSGNLKGPLVGAAFLLAIPEFLRFAELPNSIAANLRLFSYGLILVLAVHFRPQGLAGEYRY